MMLESGSNSMLKFELGNKMLLYQEVKFNYIQIKRTTNKKITSVINVH